MSASKEPPKVDYLKLIGGTSLNEEISKEDHSYLNPPRPKPLTEKQRIEARVASLKGSTAEEKLNSLMAEIEKKRPMMGKYMPKKWVKKVKAYAMCENPNTDEAEKVIKELTDAGFQPNDFIFTAFMIPAMHNAQKKVVELHGRAMSRNEMAMAISMYTNWGAADCMKFYDEWMTDEGLADNPFDTKGDDDDAA